MKMIEENIPLSFLSPCHRGCDGLETRFQRPRGVRYVLLSTSLLFMALLSSVEEVSGASAIPPPHAGRRRRGESLPQRVVVTLSLSLIFDIRIICPRCHSEGVILYIKHSWLNWDFVSMWLSAAAISFCWNYLLLKRKKKYISLFIHVKTILPFKLSDAKEKDLQKVI